MRDYILVLLAVLGIGAIFAPETPATPDLDTNTTQAVSTMTLPELTKFDEISLDNISEIAEITKKPVATTTKTSSAKTTASAVPSIPTYSVTRYSSSIVAHPDYSNIYKTGKLVYAHNTGKLFGGIRSFSVGATFNLIENGVTTTYKVSDIKTFEKNPENGLLQLNGSGNYMGTIVKTAFHHDVALMTCTGTSYGNGDASHRLVIFADKV